MTVWRSATASGSAQPGPVRGLSYLVGLLVAVLGSVPCFGQDASQEAAELEKQVWARVERPVPEFALAAVEGLDVEGLEELRGILSILQGQTAG